MNEAIAETEPVTESVTDLSSAGASVGRRERKPLNPELLARAQEAARRHLEGIDSDETPPGEEDLVPAITTASRPADAKADLPPPKEEPRRGPPPEAIEAWERVNTRAYELDQREKALREREAKYADYGSMLDEKPLDVMRSLIRAQLGDDAPDADIDAELALTLSDMSLQHLGVSPDPTNERAQANRIERELRRLKADKRRSEAERRRAAEEAEKTGRRQSAIKSLGEELSPMADRFPWLSSVEDDSDEVAYLIRRKYEPSARPKKEELLFDLIEREYKHSGRIMEVDEAAREIENLLSTSDKYRQTKRKHLLYPETQPSTPVAAPQGDPPTSRSRALSTIDASETSSIPDEGPRMYSQDEKRARAWRKLQDLQKGRSEG